MTTDPRITAAQPCRACRRAEPKTRGLCRTCYARESAAGTLEEIALPRRIWNRGTTTARAIGERRATSEGYTQVWTEDGWRMEHRVAMEAHLGRALTRGENVHHLNGVRHDNRLENLELWFSPQPYGQRVTDLIRYVAEYHAEEMAERLSRGEVAPRATEATNGRQIGAERIEGDR